MRLFTLLLFLASLLEADYLHFYDDVIEKAQKNKKFPLVMMEKAGCPWCRKMKEKTFEDPEVRHLLEKHFVVGVINLADRDFYPESLHTPLAPVTHFLDYDGEIIWQSIGYKDRKHFVFDIYEALKSWHELHPDFFKKK